MATQTQTKRVPLKQKRSANPLFVKWIEEWLQEAEEKDLASRYTYRKALKSLHLFPLKLRSGRSCAILEGFGPKLCARIDKKLLLHKRTADNGDKETAKPPKIPCLTNSVGNGNENVPGPARIVTCHTMSDDEDNIPTSASSLLSSGSHPLTQQVSLQLPDAVQVSSSPPLQSPSKRRSPANSPCKLPSPAKSPLKRIASPASSPKKKKSAESITKLQEDLILQPGSFKIILIVDNAELLSKTKKESPTSGELTSLGVAFETRSLKVGDYAWVAKEISSGKELILPYIVERKRVDDLSGSIIDGRYHEQKYRLKQCGIQNLFYLIESMGKGDHHLKLPLKTLQQASVNTQIHGEFIVKHTVNHRMSMEFLATMTKIITRTYKDKVLVQCAKESLVPCKPTDDIVSLMNFEEFNKSAVKIKKWTVREMFIKHLIQLRGMSVEKAMAIVERYPSPRALLAGYEQAGNSAASMLAKLTYGSEGKNVGPVISTAIHRLYTSNTLS